MALTQQAGFNLTPKQRAFANHYIETGSAPEAAMRAYDCSNRNSARVMAHRNLNNAKVQAYLSFQVTDTVLVDKGIKALKDGLDATKFIKLGKGKVMQVPDNQARLKAAMFYLKLVMNLPTGIETASASDDDYWEAWYMEEHGRTPTESELEKFKEARNDADVEETQTRLFSSKKRHVSFNPKDFV